ncbi:MAG: prolyl oligopeptidase family serine peptidase [Deltaproteobacteria bacterium]|jgi:polyhydroxybutyrate depolymerase|nr:prolyl oligopeptidase family serine peptidase [Deltaproteobacteria bacterium]
MNCFAKKIHPYIALTIVAIMGCATAPARSNHHFHHHSLTHNGLKRTYMIHVPPTHTKGQPFPLFIVLHGGGGDGKKAEKISGISRQSDKYGVILVYPDAVGRNWNDGRAVRKYLSHRKNIDDVGFISALIDKLRNEYAIDPKRVYVSGASNGGMMANRLACELSDKITAMAPVIAAMPENIVEQCSPSRPIPVMMINGTADPMVPWEGGYVRFIGRKKYGKILSVPDTAQFWVSHNRCKTEPIKTWLPDTVPDDGTRVRKNVFGGCKEGGEVVLYEIHGGGHTWPGGRKNAPEYISGKSTNDIDANQIIWDFFKRFNF